MDYKTLTGKRKRYFFLTENFPYVLASQHLETIGHFKELSYKTLTFNNPDQKEMNNLLHGWIRFANLFEKYLRDALQDYESNNHANI